MIAVPGPCVEVMVAWLEGSVLRPKQYVGDGLAISNSSFPIKVCRQDVCIKILEVAVELLAVNKDLRRAANRV